MDSFGLLMINALSAKHARLTRNMKNMANYNHIKSVNNSINISQFLGEALGIWVSVWILPSSCLYVGRERLSLLTDPSLSAMVFFPHKIPSLLSHFFNTVFLFWSRAWVTLVEHTFVLQNLLENVFLTERCKMAGPGKQDSWSVPIVSSSPHHCRMITQLGQRTSTLLNDLYCFFLRDSIPGSPGVC